MVKLFIYFITCAACFGQAMTTHDPAFMWWIMQQKASSACNLTFATFPSGSTRSDGPFVVGMIFETGATGPTVCSLSRLCVHTGDNQTHTVYLCAGTYVANNHFTVSSVLASTSVSMSGLSAGQSATASVTPVTLSANTVYALVCSEAGGDSWYDTQNGVTVSTGTDIGSCFITGTSTISGGSVLNFNQPSGSYDQMNLGY